MTRAVLFSICLSGVLMIFAILTTKCQPPMVHSERLNMTQWREWLEVQCECENLHYLVRSTNQSHPPAQTILISALGIKMLFTAMAFTPAAAFAVTRIFLMPSSVLGSTVAASGFGLAWRGVLIGVVDSGVLYALNSALSFFTRVDSVRFTINVMFAFMQDLNSPKFGDALDRAVTHYVPYKDLGCFALIRNQSQSQTILVEVWWSEAHVLLGSGIVWFTLISFLILSVLLVSVARSVSAFCWPYLVALLCQLITLIKGRVMKNSVTKNGADVGKGATNSICEMIPENGRNANVGAHANVSSPDAIKKKCVDSGEFAIQTDVVR